MSGLLRDRPDELAALIGAAVDDDPRIPIAFVEKDYWITELLRSVVEPLPKEQAGYRVLLKGGTSLSKAFGLIERFSEDVDILIVPPEGAGRGRNDKVLKAFVERAERNLGLTANLTFSKTGVARNAYFEYEVQYPSEFLRADGMLLEMGTRSGPEPNTEVTVRSYVAEALDRRDPGASFSDTEWFSVLAVAPERTLFEKLHLLHSLAATDSELIEGAGRHYYDVARLLDTTSVIDALADGQLVERLAADILSRGDQFPGPNIERPREGYASSPAFGRSGPIHDMAHQAYELARPLVWGDFPDFETVLDTVADLEQLL